MEATDIKLLKVTSTTTYEAVNGDLSYNVTKRIEESNLVSIVVSVTKKGTVEDQPTSDFMGIWQLVNGKKIYAPENICTDVEEATIIEDFKSILTYLEE